MPRAKKGAGATPKATKGPPKRKGRSGGSGKNTKPKFNDKGLVCGGEPVFDKAACCERILELLAQGRMVAEVCGKDGLPSIRHFMAWKREDKDLQRQFEIACEAGDYAIEAYCLEIVDDATNDWMEAVKRDGTIDVVFNKENVLRSKLRVEQRWKSLQARNNRFRNNSELTLKGDKENPITLGVVVVPAKQPAVQRTLSSHVGQGAMQQEATDAVVLLPAPKAKA